MSQDYIPLATVTLGSTASSVTFSNIPATYRDLVLVFNGTTAATPDLLLSFNGDTSNIYTNVSMEGNASNNAVSYTLTRTGVFLMSGSTNRIMYVAQVMDYRATDKHKTVISRADNAGPQTIASAGRWPSTSAITSLSASAGASTFSVGSTFNLYGIIG
jgi:hypothetical protein